MPILIGFAAAYLANAETPPGEAERGARRFIAALCGAFRDGREQEGSGAPFRGAESDGAADRFLEWATGWLDAHAIRSPILYALPAAPEAGRGVPRCSSAALAAAIAHRVGTPAAARAVLHWTPDFVPARARMDDADDLRRHLAMSEPPASGTPVLVGDVFASEALLRACALALNDAGAKPMFALYAARAIEAPIADPFRPPDQSFSVRP